MERMQSFARELIRRRVVRAGAAYAAASFVALQLAEILLPAFGSGPGSLRSMFAALLAGGPLVLAATWAYDAGARRPVREAGTHGSTARSAVPGTGPSGRLVAAVLGVASILGALGWWLVGGGPERAAASAGIPSIVVAATVFLIAGGWSLWEGPATEPMQAAPADSSIAVLPFVNWGATDDRAFLGDALADEVREQLGAAGGVQVAARSSSLESAKPPADARRVGRALGVRTLLEGSVLCCDEATRVTAQLIDTQTGFRVWSGTYAYPPDALPEDGTAIARLIVSNLLASAECRPRLGLPRAARRPLPTHIGN